MTTLVERELEDVEDTSKRVRSVKEVIWRTGQMLLYSVVTNSLKSMYALCLNY